ncbi:2473_t:CDS:2, partial [Diversispora eburnea]
MSNSSFVRTRRKGVNYGTTSRNLTQDKNKFDPIGNKQILKKQNTKNKLKESSEEENDDAIASGSNSIPQVVISNNEITENEPESYEQVIDMEEETDTGANNFQVIGGNLEESKHNKESEWQEVRRKGKNKAKDNNNNNDEEDSKSVSSYNSDSDFQTKWRKITQTPKYKIWTYATKIMGKNLGDKIDKIRQILKKESDVVLVKSEIFENNRMIAAYYDNKEEMEKGNKANVGNDADQPTYMHRAQIFKRNPERDLMHGVKLWDIPIHMTNKEIKTELEFNFGIIERMNVRTNNMWQSAVVFFKEEEVAKKEDLDKAFTFKWETEAFKIEIIDLTIKTCHRCKSTEHLAAACQRTLRDKEFKIKSAERLEKFGPMYKKHNPKYFNILSKQVSGKTYAEATKNKTSKIYNTKPSESENVRLDRIEKLLLEISN